MRPSLNPEYFLTVFWCFFPPSQDWHSSKHVAELIYKEFFTQGDLEKAMGNMPLEMMDREKAFIPELQIQFLDDVAIPVYE